MKVLLAIDDSPFSENATQLLASHYQSARQRLLSCTAPDLSLRQI